MKTPLLSRGFAALGIVMVVATITLVGFVAFRFLDAQDNTEVATDTSSNVAVIESTRDIDTVTDDLDSAQLDSIDADLDKAFSF